MGVFHSTVVAVPDDPSYPVGTDEWNAGHVDENGNPISAPRERLTADRTYYVRADGDDDNDGLANTAGGAWLTLQHAMDFIASTIDIAGFTITVSIGAGTFAGFGGKPVTGGGLIKFWGVNSASTIISTGPNDGVYNFGECFSQFFDAGAIFEFDRVTFEFPVYHGQLLNLQGNNTFYFGDYLGTYTVDIGFELGTAANVIMNISPGVVVNIAAGDISITSNGHSSSQGFSLIYGGILLIDTDIIFVDAFNSSYGFISADGGGTFVAFSATFTGTVTGPRFSLVDGIIKTPGQYGTNDLEFFPGDAAGIATAGFYDKIAFSNGGPIGFPAYNAGTVSSGTFTPSYLNGNYQYYTNDGAHTLAAPAADSALDILVTNGGSAGTITFSGFTVGANTGDALTTTNTDKFMVHIRRINGVSAYFIQALQ